jgi:hypothetical protein
MTISKDPLTPLLKAAKVEGRGGREGWKGGVEGRGRRGTVGSLL